VVLEPTSRRFVPRQSILQSTWRALRSQQTRLGVPFRIMRALSPASLCLHSRWASRRLPSIAFRIWPVIRSTLLHRFLDGTTTVSPVARHALVAMLPSHSAGVACRLGQSTPCHAGFVPDQRTWPSDSYLSRPLLDSVTLRLGDSLTIPRMALSVGFIRFVSSAYATQAMGLLTFAPVGLSRTEHASLRWTHYFAEVPSIYQCIDSAGHRRNVILTVCARLAPLLLGPPSLLPAHLRQRHLRRRDASRCLHAQAVPVSITMYNRCIGSCRTFPFEGAT
jgi:hypothetical protein